MNIGSCGGKLFNVEIALAYRTTLEVIAFDEEEAEKKALEKLSQRDLIDEAQVLVEVQK